MRDPAFWVPPCLKADWLPDSTDAVFSCKRFHAEADHLILVPSERLNTGDLPEPFMFGCDVTQCPVIRLPVQQYDSLLEGLKDCCPQCFWAEFMEAGFVVMPLIRQSHETMKTDFVNIDGCRSPFSLPIPSFPLFGAVETG